MPQYELSIDPSLVAEAERVVSLEGRGFPTIVVSWDSQLLGQDWMTILVLDYTIPLPPLEGRETFNEVRIAAHTGDVPTKFLYFGTELGQGAPRVAPEMENIVTPARTYQEYRLIEESCPIAYLDLIQTTPRIYGNGPQDYYSPPVKVERFDAGPGSNLIADHFPTVVAGLDPIPGSVLTDPRRGFWQGARFVGTRRIAILRQGKVVGLHKRASDREVVPPEVVRRDPKIDVRNAWVAIDLGRTSTVVAIGDGDSREFVRVGAGTPPKAPSDFETPSVVAFEHLPNTLKGWSDRIILPLTRWGDVYVGFGARDWRQRPGREGAQRTKASVLELGALPQRVAQGEVIQICGRNALDSTLTLEHPARPNIDEEGISPDDPFDPLELFAYYIGLHVNTWKRGIHLRYALGMPTSWTEEIRSQVLAQFRRGILRSLPAGMVTYDDTEALQVVDAGPNMLSFATQTFRIFGIAPKGMDAVPFVSIDAGANETGILCGRYREGRPDEVAVGLQRVVEHVEPSVLTDFGGETLLHRIAYWVYAASATSMKNSDIPFEPPPGAPLLQGHEERLVKSMDAATNMRLIKDAVRPILENPTPTPLPESLQLFSREGEPCEVRVMIDRAALGEWLRGQMTAVGSRIKQGIDAGFQQMSRDEPPYQSLRVLLGGRLSMNALFQEGLEAALPKGVRIHKFREPDSTNMAAPTVKLAPALGILALRFQPVAPSAVHDNRTAFHYRVGRAKRGKLHAVLDGSTGFDVWRELGACTRPEVTVLYTSADASPDMSADDPAVQSVTCTLGYDAVGYRIYMRAVGGSRVELSVGPPGGRPGEDAPHWSLDLAAGTAQVL